MNVGGCVEDGVFRLRLHKKADETGVNVQVRQKRALIGLPTQFDRQVASKRGGAHAPLSAYHANHSPLFRCGLSRGFLAGSPDGVLQSLYENFTVTSAL